ncbi:MAG: hypothetical protein ACI9EF_000373 [Pseudohongiellaceae bacterium]|jgi:hypothetical protein
MEVRVTNLGAKRMTALVDAAYANFIAQLKASGREVLSLDEMRSPPGYSGLDFVQGDEHGFYLQTAGIGAPKGAVAVSASGQPLWWTNGKHITGHLVGPVFDQNNHKALQWVSKGNKAIVIYPVFNVNFLDMESSGRDNNDLGGGTAEVSADTNMTISVAYNIFDGQTLYGRSCQRLGQHGRRLRRHGHHERRLERRHGFRLRRPLQRGQLVIGPSPRARLARNSQADSRRRTRSERRLHRGRERVRPVSHGSTVLGVEHDNDSPMTMVTGESLLCWNRWCSQT